jgi:ABC-type uncharacterized transport system permease subunit
MKYTLLFWAHLGFFLAGIAGLFISVLSAFLYLLQSARLKSKSIDGKLFSFPSLDTLDRWHFRSLSWGALFFTIGILSGVLWAKKLNQLTDALKEPMVLLSFLTCFFYWVIFTFRASKIRRGKKIALGTLFIFILLVLTLVSFYCPYSPYHRGF